MFKRLSVVGIIMVGWWGIHNLHSPVWSMIWTALMAWYILACLLELIGSAGRGKSDG